MSSHANDPDVQPPRQRGAGDAAPAGSELRGARLSQGLTPADVETQLGIRAEYIVAIERGTLADLPGEAFHTGYVRSYADFINTEKYFGHDGEWYVQQLCGVEPVAETTPTPHKDESTAGSGMTALPVADPRFTTGMRQVVLGVVAVLAVAVVVGGWSLFHVVQRVELLDAPRAGFGSASATIPHP